MLLVYLHDCNDQCLCTVDLQVATDTHRCASPGATTARTEPRTMPGCRRPAAPARRSAASALTRPRPGRRPLVAAAGGGAARRRAPVRRAAATVCRVSRPTSSPTACVGWSAPASSSREPYSQRPLRVRYRLTVDGQELAGVLRLLAAWGARTSARPTGEESLPASRRHEPCGTPLEARWYCPTCARVTAEDEVSELRYL